MLPRSTPRLSAPGRMELSPDLISACLALEKYLENPNALTERELVQWGPGPERGGGLCPFHPHPGFSLSTVSPCALDHGDPRILAGSLWGAPRLESWSLERLQGGAKDDCPPANPALVPVPSRA